MNRQEMEAGLCWLREGFIGVPALVKLLEETDPWVALCSDLSGLDNLLLAAYLASEHIPVGDEATSNQIVPLLRDTAIRETSLGEEKPLRMVEQDGLEEVAQSWAAMKLRDYLRAYCRCNSTLGGQVGVLTTKVTVQTSVTYMATQAGLAVAAGPIGLTYGILTAVSFALLQLGLEKWCDAYGTKWTHGDGHYCISGQPTASGYFAIEREPEINRTFSDPTRTVQVLVPEKVSGRFVGKTDGQYDPSIGDQILDQVSSLPHSFSFTLRDSTKTAIGKAVRVRDENGVVFDVEDHDGLN